MTGDDEVVIQGDVCDNAIDFIQTHWPEVKLFCTMKFGGTATL